MHLVKNGRGYALSTCGMRTGYVSGMKSPLKPGKQNKTKSGLPEPRRADLCHLGRKEPQA
eukprot:9277908-Prorocentrum_lima.AAC.1